MTVLWLIPNPADNEADQQSAATSQSARTGSNFTVLQWLSKGDREANATEMGLESLVQLDSLASSPLLSLSTIPEADSQQGEPQEPADAGLSIAERLAKATQSLHDAELLHAYDVGVNAALHSMAEYWAQRARELHVSSSEKRIFEREAQRVAELVVDAERETMKSNDRLVQSRRNEQRLRGELGVGGAPLGEHPDDRQYPAWMGSEILAALQVRTESISQLSIGEPLVLQDDPPPSPAANRGGV
ncbi:hypothetical protein B0T26DRAFT_805055 [Lasiosphaeria miniovina]|uniref:Uncharacterized protein n=1 Tax=Lasiosphaeria miniovina TaxID=1954250 RepID=A0AA40DMN1_9PEZI|nr:uncharacterized protein B0T26DRAFT_805055 [Lasiosphaeria miniovina]KAK0709309.1 hypothetical protein B0T26DRAFT_805055 [Lasiosphaeria miniovina]